MDFDLNLLRSDSDSFTFCVKYKSDDERTIFHNIFITTTILTHKSIKQIEYLPKTLTVTISRLSCVPTLRLFS